MNSACDNSGNHRSTTSYRLEQVKLPGSGKLLVLVETKASVSRDEMVSHLFAEMAPVSVLTDCTGSWHAFDMQGKQMPLQELERLYPVAKFLDAMT